MKKMWKILLVIIMVILISACQNGGSSDPIIVDEAKVKEIADKMEFPSSTSTDIVFPKEFTYDEITLSIKWFIQDVKLIKYDGKITKSYEDSTTTLKATFSYGDIKYSKEYVLTIEKYSNIERLNMEIVNFELPQVFEEGFVLPKTTKDKEISVSWDSSHPTIINGNGVVYVPNQITTVTLTLNLTLGEDILKKEFNMMGYKSQEIVSPVEETVVHTATDFDKGTLIDLEIDQDGYVVMTKLTGTYVSPIYQTNDFKDLVGSWSAITSQKSGSVELQYRVKVEEEWSSYVTYGKWRYGDKNYNKDEITPDGLIEMETDTIFPLKGKSGSAYQYRVIFRRTENQESPKLLCVATAINLGLADNKPENIKESVVYDVPKLYQNQVPGIGGSICSPTSTTMLLKYYGHSFEGLGYKYEHEYMAHAVFDHGSDIFGNWVYNVAVMGAVGEFAYVKRFTGPYELVEHLSNVGPVSLSVKGNMQGIYTTGGHLLVCKGYKIVDGEYVFICNDPALSYVEVEYTYETIKNVWRNIAYVIENR